MFSLANRIIMYPAKHSLVTYAGRGTWIVPVAFWCNIKQFQEVCGTRKCVPRVRPEDRARL